MAIKDKEKAKSAAKDMIGFMTAQDLLDNEDNMTAAEWESEAFRILTGDAIPKDRSHASIVMAIKDRAEKIKKPGNAMRPLES